MIRELLIDWNEYPCGANGQIYSHYYKKMLKGSLDKDGYVMTALKCIDGKKRRFRWHRVIYTYFYGAIPEGYVINHINEDKTDNRLCNLEVCTIKYNNTYNGRHLRVAAKKRGILNTKPSKAVVAVDNEGNVVYEFASTMEAGRHGFSQASVSRCCRGLEKSHKGLRWFFKKDWDGIIDCYPNLLMH